jgi:hypothetical protein
VKPVYYMIKGSIKVDGSVTSVLLIRNIDFMARYRRTAPSTGTFISHALVSRHDDGQVTETADPNARRLG